MGLVGDIAVNLLGDNIFYSDRDTRATRAYQLTRVVAEDATQAGRARARCGKLDGKPVAPAYKQPGATRLPPAQAPAPSGAAGPRTEEQRGRAAAVSTAVAGQV